MEFRYSEIISPVTYKTDGLCHGIDLRRHKDPMGEIRGAIRCQKDWSKLVGPVSNYKGTLGNPFSFIRVTVPESLPERLEIISYANEFAFLYDDTVMEDLDQNLVSPCGFLAMRGQVRLIHSKESKDRHRILDEFSKGDLSRSNYSGHSVDTALKGKGAMQIQSQILNEMMVIDKERGLTTMKSWQRFVQVAAGRQRSEPFAGLEEYLPYRISDAGELFWFGLVTFAMALTIPDKEMDLCKQLGRPAWAALALTNDLYSWEKERDAAEKLGAPHVINAIWVIMAEYTITESQAQDVCRRKIKEYVAEAVEVVEKTKRNFDVSLELRTYTEAILYSISGNLVWSIYCPRYHSEESYEDVVLSMMAEVT